MAKIVKREQFVNAVLRLRAAQGLADDALIVHHSQPLSEYHLAELERCCDQIEGRIAAFRLELQAQRSRVESPDEVVF